jgi:hypothetical protein
MLYKGVTFMRLINFGSGETRLETIISYILVVRVIVCLLLEIAGIIFYYQTYGSLQLLTQDPDLFIHGQNFFTFLYGIFNQPDARSSSVFLMTRAWLL